MLHWKYLFIKTYSLPDFNSAFSLSVRDIPNRFEQEMLGDHDRNLSEEEKLIIDYHAYVQSSIFSKWIEDGMKVSPEQLASLMMKFLPEIMREFIDD